MSEIRIAKVSPPLTLITAFVFCSLRHPAHFYPLEKTESCQALWTRIHQRCLIFLDENEECDISSVRKSVSS